MDNLAKVGTIVGSVDEILLKPEQDHGTQPAQLGRPDIALDHVSFGYAQDKEILHNISLTIPAGSLTALVGPSGSGKSTIAKLIAGFWDVTEGRITLGGVRKAVSRWNNSMTRWPLFLRTITSLTIPSGKISVWAG